MTELEAALEKRKNSYKFSTPGVQIIGFGTYSRSKPAGNEVEINTDQDQQNEGDNESYISDRHSDIIEMIDELEDSTEMPFEEREGI